MRVILDLEETVLETLQKQADVQRRSRKNYMESILVNTATSIPTSAYVQRDQSLQPKLEEPAKQDAPTITRKRSVIELTRAKEECLTPEDWAVLVEEIKRTPMREYEKNALLRPL